MASINIRVESRKVGDGWIAMTNLGGIPVRGKRVPGDKTEVLAIRNLLWKLAGEGSEDEPLLALELELAGTSLGEEFGMVPERAELPGDGPIESF